MTRHRSVAALVAAVGALGLLGTLAAIPNAAAGTAPASNAAAADDTPLQDPQDFLMTRSADNPVVEDLLGILPNRTVSQVVADANRIATSCNSGATNHVAGFCWNAGDNGTSDWWTQGITTTADADASGSYDGETLVLVAWYFQPDNGRKGVRVSFVDWSDPSSPEYRHVLLVDPYDDGGTPTFRAVPVHAGGMFWYGPYLYVADTWNGYRVFDMRHLMEVDTGDTEVIGLQPDGTYQAHDYKYILPQLFTYDHSTTGGETGIRMSFTGLDRTSSPHTALAGEYSDGTRLFRFPLDESTHLLAEGADGAAVATEAHSTGIGSMQGVAAIDGTFYFTASHGINTRGSFYRFAPGSSPVQFSGHLPIGPEDLSYWGGRGQLWSNSEYPGMRNVYAIDASAYE